MVFQGPKKFPEFYLLAFAKTLLPSSYTPTKEIHAWRPANHYPYALSKSFFSKIPKLESALCGAVMGSEQQTWRRKKEAALAGGIWG